MGRYRSVIPRRPFKADGDPQVYEDYEGFQNVSFWPKGESEEGRQTGILDADGHPIIWYPERIGFIRDDDTEGSE